MHGTSHAVHCVLMIRRRAPPAYTRGAWVYIRAVHVHWQFWHATVGADRHFASPTSGWSGRFARSKRCVRWYNTSSSNNKVTNTRHVIHMTCPRRTAFLPPPASCNGTHLIVHVHQCCSQEVVRTRLDALEIKPQVPRLLPQAALEFGPPPGRLHLGCISGPLPGLRSALGRIYTPGLTSSRIPCPDTLAPLVWWA